MVAYRAIMKKYTRTLPADGLFVYNYFKAAWAIVEGLAKSKGAVGVKLQASLRTGVQGAVPGRRTAASFTSTPDGRRFRTSTSCQLVKKADGSVGPSAIAYVPNVDQSFGGLFKPYSPPPGRTQPPCKKLKTPWQGKIKVVKNGEITNAVIK